MNKKKTSQYKGVRAERNQWRADIQVKGKKKFLGYFKNEIEAAQAYDQAILYYGLTRVANFPKQAKKITGLPMKDILMSTMKLTTASVDVEHTNLMTLKGVVIEAINDFTSTHTRFTSDDVSEWVLLNMANGNVALTDKPFVFSDGKWNQDFAHEDVKEIVVDMYEKKMFKAIFTSKNKTYQPV